MIKPNEIKKKFVEYMIKKGYSSINSDSLVNETFPTCFTVSGGPNFVNRYLRENSKSENSVVVQPCHRFWDVEAVGDGRHLSFFEMAVTNSFNGVPREEMYKTHLDFLTKELGLNKDYFTVSTFDGGECYNAKFEPDEEAIKIWKKLGLTRFEKSEGFGLSPYHKRPVNSSFVANTVEPVGGPRTEINYGELEVWTSVKYNTFVDYDKENNSLSFKPIGESTIVAGLGLERAVQASMGLKSIDDVYKSNLTSNPFVVDHIRGLVFLAKDGAFELSGRTNRQRKTILNSYLRSFFDHYKQERDGQLEGLISEAIGFYEGFYPELKGTEKVVADKIRERKERLSDKR